MNVYDFTVKDRKGSDISLMDYKGKVLLIVNTATGCGFTPQYEELQEIYEEFKDKGFEILDFPCNQFGEQAKGSDVALGAYHFFSFDSPGSDQAENFIASAKASWSDPAIRALRPAVDVEWYGDKEQNPPVTEDVHRELRAFVDGVEAACGQKPLIYAGNDIYDRYLRGYFDDCELWIACRKWPAWVEWPRGGWTIWQYSDTGELAGALNEAGHVDLDVLAEGVSVEDLAVSPKSYR
jgi:GH25 family lysozyme M1 (1,4-beta-N-acetylmuramidase)